MEENVVTSELTGVLNLEIGRDRNGKSIAKKIFHKGGIKIQRPVYLDGGNTPCFYILNPHGAFLDSDVYQMDIRLQEESRLTLTTQGASIIYKTPEKEAYQEANMFLAKGSYLEYLPGAIIGYKNAKFFQKNIFHLEKGATLLYLEVITSGWSPEGDPFTFTSLRLQSEIYKDEELVVYDHIKLAPEEQNFNVLGFMEGYSHVGTFMVVSDEVDDDIIDRVYQVLSEEDYDVKFGISKLSVPGFTIRILSNMTQHIEWLAMKCRNFLNEEWYGTSLGTLRKY
ncbi:MAG TPA: urease accessory protein UreD [Flavobacteriaceae bacterium]|nr:urease accessory protein UreD [Flavobacteriaceae bacterium]